MNFKATVKMAARSWLMMAIMAVLVLMFFPALVSGGATLRLIINFAVTIASLMFAYANGANMGEGEITYGEMLQKREQGSYALTDADKAKCYNRGRGFLALLLGALPWVIMAAVVLISGIGYTHKAAEATPSYLFPEASAIVMTAHEVIDVVARVLFAAFMGYYEFIDAAQPGLLDQLFLPLSFVYPLALFLGYLTGPIQHKKKLKLIEEGKRKKLRKIRADQKRKNRTQQPKQPKPEV